MVIKNIIKTACVFLQKNDLLDVTALDGAGVATSVQTAELNLLLKCLNLVYNQIASDYIPLFKTEKIMPTNGEIALSSFTNNVLEIKRVEDEFGLRASYKLYPDKIATINGEVTVTYSYEPTTLANLTSVMESFSQKITERVMAYGVVMEYCFINGLHDDASIWEKRFKDGLLIAIRKKSEIRLPSRRWN